MGCKNKESDISVANLSLKKQNILFISIDDFRPKISSYGETKMITPNIDKLAQEGVLFWQAYSPAPTCSPSRGAILSGKHPVRIERTNVRGGHQPLPFNHGST